MKGCAPRLALQKKVQDNSKMAYYSSPWGGVGWGGISTYKVYGYGFEAVQSGIE